MHSGHKSVKPSRNGRNIIVGCYMLRSFANPVACLLLRVIGNCNSAQFETGQRSNF